MSLKYFMAYGGGIDTVFSEGATNRLVQSPHYATVNVLIFVRGKNIQNLKCVGYSSFFAPKVCLGPIVLGPQICELLFN